MPETVFLRQELYRQGCGCPLGAAADISPLQGWSLLSRPPPQGLRPGLRYDALTGLSDTPSANSLSAPKGRNNIAQGTALGIPRPTRTQALKGRHNPLADALVVLDDTYRPGNTATPIGRRAMPQLQVVLLRNRSLWTAPVEMRNRRVRRERRGSSL